MVKAIPNTMISPVMRTACPMSTFKLASIFALVSPTCTTPYTLEGEDGAGDSNKKDGRAG